MNLELLKQINILIVKGDKALRDDLSALLKKTCKSVTLAKDGKEGLFLFKTNPQIDIIITETNMPNLSGIDMTKEIRKRNKDIPIIFITDTESVECLRESIKLKIESVLLKPINKKELAISVLNISTALFSQKTVKTQFEELTCLKNNIEKHNAVIKINEELEILSTNDIFTEVFKLDDSNFKLNDLFIYERDKEAFVDTLMDVYRDGSWCGDLFLKDVTGVNKAIYLEIVLEKNLFQDSISYILIMKDLSEKYNVQRNIKKSLMKKNSEIYMTGRETIGEIEKEFISLQKEIKHLESQNSELLSNSANGALGELSQLRLLQKSLIKENSELVKFKKESLSNSFNIDDLEDENQNLKTRIKAISDEKDDLINSSKLLQYELDDLKTKKDTKAAETRINYWRNQCRELESDKLKVAKQLKEFIERDRSLGENILDKMTNK